MLQEDAGAYHLVWSCTVHYSGDERRERGGHGGDQWEEREGGRVREGGGRRWALAPPFAAGLVVVRLLLPQQWQGWRATTSGSGNTEAVQEGEGESLTESDDVCLKCDIMLFCVNFVIFRWYFTEPTNFSGIFRKSTSLDAMRPTFSRLQNLFGDEGFTLYQS